MIKSAEDYLSQLQNVKRQGSGWQASCPLHEDNSPSFSIKNRVNKKGELEALAYCHAGCSQESIVNWLHGETITIPQYLIPATAEKILEKPKKKAVPVKWFNYIDENGLLLYQNIRYEPKTFSQRRKSTPEEKKKTGYAWVNKLGDVRRILYNLPELIKPENQERLLMIPEGEGKVDSLKNLGILATTNINGGKYWDPGYNPYFKDRHVVICEDNDTTGKERSTKLIANILPLCKSLKILTFEQLPEHGDIKDWIEQGGTKEHLAELLKELPDLKKLILEEKVLEVLELESKEIIEEIEDSLNELSDFFDSIITEDLKQEIPENLKEKFDFAAELAAQGENVLTYGLCPQCYNTGLIHSTTSDGKTAVLYKMEGDKRIIMKCPDHTAEKVIISVGTIKTPSKKDTSADTFSEF